MSQNKEKFLALYSFFNQEQSKYVYFLLVASVSSIAFWINRTSNLKINFFHLGSEDILLLSSALFWLLSISVGLRNRGYILSIAYSNMDALLMQDGTHPKSFNNPTYNQVAYEGIMEAIKNNSKKAVIYFKIQFYFFCAGVIFFSIWHILQISDLIIG